VKASRYLYTFSTSKYPPILLMYAFMAHFNTGNEYTWGKWLGRFFFIRFPTQKLYWKMILLSSFTLVWKIGPQKEDKKFIWRALTPLPGAALWESNREAGWGGGGFKGHRPPVCRESGLLLSAGRFGGWLLSFPLGAPFLHLSVADCFFLLHISNSHSAFSPFPSTNHSSAFRGPHQPLLSPVSTLAHSFHYSLANPFPQFPIPLYWPSSHATCLSFRSVPPSSPFLLSPSSPLPHLHVPLLFPSSSRVLPIACPSPFSRNFASQRPPSLASCLVRLIIHLARNNAASSRDLPFALLLYIIAGCIVHTFNPCPLHYFLPLPI
jgi:hypothetical protein